MRADSLLSIEIKSPPPEEFEYKTPIEMDHNNRSKTFLKLHLNFHSTTSCGGVGRIRVKGRINFCDILQANNAKTANC